MLLMQGLGPHVCVHGIGKAEPGDSRVQGQPGCGGLVLSWWNCLRRFRSAALLEEAFGSKSLTDLQFALPQVVDVSSQLSVPDATLPAILEPDPLEQKVKLTSFFYRSPRSWCFIITTEK